METNIVELFDAIIKQYRTLEPSREKFNEYLQEDSDISESYKEWCDAMGYSERKGFSEYYQEYIEQQDSIWDSIYPNKEEYEGY